MMNDELRLKKHAFYQSQGVTGVCVALLFFSTKEDWPFALACLCAGLLLTIGQTRLVVLTDVLMYSACASLSIVFRIVDNATGTIYFSAMGDSVLIVSSGLVSYFVNLSAAKRDLDVKFED